MKRFSAAISIALFLALTACGGGSSDNSSDNSSANAASGGAMSAASAMPTDPGGAAVIPASLHCGAVKPVWVNTSTRVYHEQADPYYGKTKHGEYMCPSTAKKDGYRAAGASAMKSH
jgi:hypothetical protein